MSKHAATAPSSSLGDAAVPAAKSPAQWTDYLQLLKPRVMSLVVFTALTGLGGMTYLAVAALGGLVFLFLAWKIFKSRAGDAADPRQDDGLYDVKAAAKDARNLFAFSILYLTLLFATLLAEHLLDLPALPGVFR